MSLQTRVIREVERVGNGPIVFICQNQHRWDEDLRAFVPKYDYTKAARFGTLVEVLSPTAAPFHFDRIVDDLHDKLRHYREGDYLLLVGNPVFIGAITALAASYNEGKVSALQWSGKDRDYIPINMEDLTTEKVGGSE